MSGLGNLRGPGGAVLLAVALVVVAVFAWRFLPLDSWIEFFAAWIGGLGALGVIAFALVYVVGSLVFAPGSLMSIAAGLAFGFWGIPFVMVAGTLAAAAGFLVARHLARDRVERALEHRPKFKAIAGAIDEEGWKVVGLLRLSPPFPFAAVNYFFGVTRVGFWPFVVTTFFGVVPATTVYVYIGAVGLKASSGEMSAVEWGALAIGLLAAVLAGTLVTRKAAAKLREIGGDGLARAR